MNPSEAKAAVAAVFDRSADSYEQVGPQFFTPFGQALVERAGIVRGDRVLDVGCGRGHVLIPAAAAAGPEGSVVGTDLAPGMVERTAEATASLPHVTVLLGDAAAPDFPDASFDVILAGLVIFFLPEPDKALVEYRRLLKPGGRMAFTTFGKQDPVFDAVVKRIASFAPSAPGERPADRFRDQASILEFMDDWDDASISEVTVETRFADSEQWWQWLWSHGMRALLEMLPEDVLPSAREAAFEVMESARTPAGDFAIHTDIRVTTAKR